MFGRRARGGRGSFSKGQARGGLTWRVAEGQRLESVELKLGGAAVLYDGAVCVLCQSFLYAYSIQVCFVRVLYDFSVHFVVFCITVLPDRAARVCCTTLLHN